MQYSAFSLWGMQGEKEKQAVAQRNSLFVEAS